MRRLLLLALVMVGVLALAPVPAVQADGSAYSAGELLQNNEHAPADAGRADQAFESREPIETGSLPAGSRTEASRDSFNSPNVDIYPGGPMSVSTQ